MAESSKKNDKKKPKDKEETKEEPKVAKTSNKVKKLPRETQTKLKKPGQVVILLTGKDAGKRVVFLKHISLKYILINGPANFNGVTLKIVRTNEVIVTSTIVNMDKNIKLNKYNLAYFIKPKKKKEKTQQAFFEEEEQEKDELPDRIENQKELDAAMEKSIEKKYVAYLKSEFRVTDETRPHLMKF